MGIVTFSTTDPLPRTTEEARARLSELQMLRCPRCDRGEGVAIMAQHPLCVSRVAPSQLGPLVRVALASPPPSASRCNPAPLGVHMERSFDACFALRCPSCPAATITQVGLLYLSPRSEGLVERVGPLLRVVPPPCGARRGSAQPRPRLHGGAPRHLGYIAADTSARSRLDSAHRRPPICAAALSTCTTRTAARMFLPTRTRSLRHIGGVRIAAARCVSSGACRRMAPSTSRCWYASWTRTSATSTLGCACSLPAWKLAWMAQARGKKQGVSQSAVRHRLNALERTRIFIYRRAEAP